MGRIRHGNDTHIHMYAGGKPEKLPQVYEYRYPQNNHHNGGDAKMPSIWLVNVNQPRQYAAPHEERRGAHFLDLFLGEIGNESPYSLTGA